MTSALSSFARTQVRFLFMRPTPIAKAERLPFLIMAIGVTWLAGAGRYWDHPSPEPWQLLGLGSVIYVFALAAVLWLFGLPLRPRGWSYANVLLFVSLTSLPALLYAIPVERFTSFPVAQSLNRWFLAVVAIWRVALLIRFLVVTADLGVMAGITVALLPLALIVNVLFALNLEQATFDLMAGLDREGEFGGTTNDGAYAIVANLAFISMLALLPLLFAYGAAIVARWPESGGSPS